MEMCKSCGRTVNGNAPCMECPEPRASIMPPHVAPIDPAFLSALREPVPDEAMREKSLPERARRAGL